jgi:uncharacterized membrane protein YkoI
MQASWGCHGVVVDCLKLEMVPAILSMKCKINESTHMKITRTMCALMALGLAACFLTACATEKEDGESNEKGKAANLKAHARLTKAEAETIALAKAPGGTIKEGELEQENGKLIWSFDIATPGTKDITEVQVDAMSGEIVDVSKETVADQEKETHEDSAKAKQAGKALANVKFSHPRQITNPYLPLASLQQDILEGKEGGKQVRIERTLKPELRKTFKVSGQTVEALVVEDREFENGKLAEIALDYFAQADDGTVYYLGEAVDVYKSDKVVGHSGAWLYGVQTKVPGVIMPADPKVGDTFRPEDVPSITTEDDEVLALTETVTVPAGTYENCLKVKEVLSDGGIEYKHYAKGVGCFREASEGSELLLKSHTAR